MTMQRSKHNRYTKLQKPSKSSPKIDSIPKSQITISKFFASHSETENQNATDTPSVISADTDPHKLLYNCIQENKIDSVLKKRQRDEQQASCSKRLCLETPLNLQRNCDDSITQTESSPGNIVSGIDHPPSKLKPLSTSTKLKLKAYVADLLSEQTVDFETIRQRCGRYSSIIEDDQSVCHISDEEPNNELEAGSYIVGGDNSTSRLGRFSQKSAEINKKTKTKFTPLEQQFIKLKENHPDALLFVECGYKYRFFGEDAEIASNVLKIYCRMDHNFMTASIPTHRLFVHVRRLVAAGYKVGVVKQTETAALKAAGDNRAAPFTRCLSALYTKSTLIGEDVDPLCIVDEDYAALTGDNATLMCVWDVPTEKNSKKHQIGIVAVQPATGELVYDCFDDNVTRSELETHICHIQPVELLISDSVDAETEKLVLNIASLSSVGDDRIRVEKLSNQLFLYSKAFEIVSDFYSTDSADSSSLQEVVCLPKPVISCLAATIIYLKEFKLDNVMKNTCNFSYFCMRNNYMYLNGNAVRQLELFINQTDKKEKKGTLFHIFNRTVSKFGARMLKTWMKRPLLDISIIKKRQTAVSELITPPCAVLKKLKEVLSKSPDLEKGLCSIYHKKCSTSEFYAVCKTFHSILNDLKSDKEDMEQAVTSELLKEIINEVEDLLDTSCRFYNAIQEKGARNGNKTELFKEESMFPSLLEIRQKIHLVKQEIQAHNREFCLQLRQPSLDYVTVSGTEFLIEVKNKDLKLVPKDWTKISSTKSMNRFHTPFIEEKYKLLNQLREKLTIHCNEAWQQFLGWFGEHYHQYRKAIQHLATLDCLFSMAAVAQRHGYCRPKLAAGTGIDIKAGRHPIVDQLLGEHEQFVPNDTNLHQENNRLMVITGPNMGGKSSYIKQVALITIMAQMGSYIPAEEASIGVVDAIFTRLGAADDVMRGRSTFMVELQEVSEIMNQATDKSLIILDELGRGTSTHDGVAIAYATLHYFIKEIKCLTLFVTHYIILSEFEQIYLGLVKNYHMSFLIHEEEDEKDDRTKALTFLYQVVSGMADQSYGLNVARLASIPKELIHNASIQSRQLEEKVQLNRRSLEHFDLLYSCDEENIHTHLKSIQESSMEVQG